MSDSAQTGMGVIRFLTIAAGVLLTVAAPDAAAQYFGRNKVEYADFDFRILSTNHFDVYYYGREERAARIAAQLAERWYSRFAKVLGHDLDARQPLVLYGSQPEFAQTNVIGGLLSDTVGGVTESARRRIAMPFAPTLAETSRVLGHEIAHAFQFDIARRHGGGTGQPLWFVEGMAEYLARGARDPEAVLWARDAVLSDLLPARQRNAARRLSPYHYGHAFWSYLAERFGDQVLNRALTPGKKERNLNQRMQHATGLDLDALYADWREAVTSDYAAASRDADAMAAGRAMDGAAFGRVQLGPSLSPDGRQAVFFSERDRLSLDLFLADVETGRIVRKLATTTASARFDSLQPLRSAGAWSPDGEWFAFAAVSKGHAALTLVNMRRAAADREVVLKDVGQVLSPCFSPDGQRIAFSALNGGFADLYVYDLSTGDLRQLTADPFSDLHPAWSPDGGTIAFATDRYSTDLDSLVFGPLQLAMLDLRTGIVNRLAGDAGAAQINPQWSADGRSIYFVATSGGVANVFRLDRESRIARRITNVPTAVSGITPTSPALSVAGYRPALAFTVYRAGRPRLVLLDDVDRIEGEVAAPVATTAEMSAAQTDRSGTLADVLADSRTGLPEPGSISTRDYSPRLTLERMGQPYLSSGGGPFGTFVRGGWSLLFGDMLGERRLGAAVQVSNRLREAALDLRFLNQAHRWNWGALAELEPAIARHRRTEDMDFEGESAVSKQVDYLQRIQFRAAGLVAYPFSRGLRLELTGGVRAAGYRRDLRTQISSRATGRILEESRIQSSGGDATTVAEVGAALVGDTTVFGATAPILGSRYRFEIAPALGSLAYTRLLVDYRRYLMPIRPYSIAVRLLHTGRYGSDGNDPRLLSSFLGSRYFVRGHGLDARYCRPDPNRPCGDELLGHRLLVGNIELRVPVWGILSRQLEYGPLPADAFVFADGGIVWARGDDAFMDSATMTRSRRTTISSAGVGLRLNAGGLPFEIAGVRALDGPAPRWLVDFGFRVGF